MFMETPETLLYVAIGAFVLGWIVAKLSAALAGHIQARKRDPRDDRIRNLEAELRIAQTDGTKARDQAEALKQEIDAERKRVEDRDQVIAGQQEKISRLRADLKDSVKKTRELRAELSDRAEESLRSEVKLREVETELSVAQASTDLIATGVLDYSIAPDPEDEEESPGRANVAP